MKKMIMIVISLVLSMFILSACKDGSDLGAALEQHFRDLESQMMDLEVELENSNISLEDYENRIAVLESERVKTRSSLSNLQNKITLLEQYSNESVKIFLAEEYYLIPGETFQLFYRSIIGSPNPYQYYIKLTGTVGNGYNRYYEWTPEASHDGKSYPLKIEVCNDSGIVLCEASTILKVKSVKAGSAKNILCIGDSLTVNGYWVSHGFTQFRNAGGANHTFLGTIKGGYLGNTMNYEGRGGWQWSTYLTKYDTIDTPFKANTASGISFSQYASKWGYSGIDELYILMTWNGIGGSFRTFSMTAEPFLSAKKLIDQYHSDYPNGKVTLLGIPQPSVNSGLGSYYSIKLNYGDNYGQFVTALNYNKQLEDFTKMSAYSSFMRYVDVKAQFDSEYNMPSTAKPVNKYSSVTEKIGTSMGMHPETAGYLQIGDVFYRALAHGWDS